MSAFLEWVLIVGVTIWLTLWLAPVETYFNRNRNMDPVNPNYEPCKPDMKDLKPGNSEEKIDLSAGPTPTYALISEFILAN